jgi:hypothetical protein
VVTTGPIDPGASYRFVIPVGGAAKYFDYAQMWTPSNDTFLSLGPKGVSLLTAAGAVRPLADINAEIAQLLGAWDAGTEANQAGAREGRGMVRKVDQAFAFPAVKHLASVRIKPL